MISFYFDNSFYTYTHINGVLSVYFEDGRLIADAAPSGIYTYFESCCFVSDEIKFRAGCSGQSCVLAMLMARDIVEAATWLIKKYPEAL